MNYESKNFEHLLGINGFSDNLLKNHLGLYGGYVANVNKLADNLAGMLSEGKILTPEYSEMKRRFSWEFDGMRLHEFYFGNITGKTTPFDKNSELAKKIEISFGSYENWEKDFKAVGAMRGIGWAILYFDYEASRFFNVWVNEHEAGHLISCVPLLIMDVFEHAYIIDYGIKKADYIEAFFKVIDWNVVNDRLASK